MAERRSDEPVMDAKGLYLEETFTDRQVGTIRRLTPVKKDGSPDAARQTVFIGQAQLYTPAGLLPLNFELSARTLEEAVAQFAKGASKAVDEAMQHLNELRREAASSIVVPGAGSPGRGGIQLP